MAATRAEVTQQISKACDTLTFLLVGISQIRDEDFYRVKETVENVSVDLGYAGQDAATVAEFALSGRIAADAAKAQKDDKDVPPAVDPDDVDLLGLVDMPDGIQAANMPKPGLDERSES